MDCFDLKNRIINLLICSLVLSNGLSQAQDSYSLTQFFFNPALLNASYTGSDERLALYASYRQQWAGVEGAPTIGNFSLQTSLPNRVNLGLTVSNDKNGLLSTSGGLLTAGYSLPLTAKNYLRFGISLGGSWNKVDLNSLRFATASDPVQSTLLANNSQLLGNIGFSFHSATFHGGISVPNIFEPVYLSSESFSVSKVSPFGTVIAHASNRFYFSDDKNMVEPFLVYRYNQNQPSQFEFATVLHLQHVVWIGGSFKQDNGLSALAGLKLKGQMAVGYSYSIANSGANQMPAPSHEIQIGLLFGTKLKKIHAYSFVDAEKEKPTRAKKQLVAQKKTGTKGAAKKKKEAQKKKELADKKKQEQAALTLARSEALRKANDAKLTKEVKTTPIDTKETNKNANVVHSGGPRLRAQKDFLAGQDKIDSIHNAEQAHLNRLDDHAADPNELHGLANDAHAHAERHEFVKQGGHQAELEIGDYVISGVFKLEENAKKLSEGLVKLGFKDSDYGYLTLNNLWYVHVAASNDLTEIRKQRDKFRAMKIFKDAWLLTVHK